MNFRKRLIEAALVVSVAGFAVAQTTSQQYPTQTYPTQQYPSQSTDTQQTQSDHDWQRNRGVYTDETTADRQQRSAAYRDGVRNGRIDARSGERTHDSTDRWSSDQDRLDYAAGYSAGYQRAQNNNGTYQSNRDRTTDENSRYDQYGNRRDRDRDRTYNDENGQYDQYGNRRDRDDRDRDRSTYGVPQSDQGTYGDLTQAARSNGYQDGLRDGASDRQNGNEFQPTQSSNYRTGGSMSSDITNRAQYRRFYQQGYAQGYRRGYYGQQQQ